MHIFIACAFIFMEMNGDRHPTSSDVEAVAEASVQQKRMRRKLLQSIQGGTSQLPPLMIAEKQPNGLYEV